MEIVGKVAATIQYVLGPETEELGRATGIIQRRRKFTAVSLLRMLGSSGDTIRNPEFQTRFS